MKRRLTPAQTAMLHYLNRTPSGIVGPWDGAACAPGDPHNGARLRTLRALERHGLVRWIPGHVAMRLTDLGAAKARSLR